MKLQALVDWYSTLAPETVADLREYYHEDAHFHDPFNDVRGHAAIIAIFRHMFETTQNPAFVISAVHDDGNTAWVSWTFEFRLFGRSLSVDGVTRLDFGADGRVIDHIDYWDSADVFVQIPLLGRILRMLKNRIRTPQPDESKTRAKP